MTLAVLEARTLAPGELITEPGIYDLTPEQYHSDPVEGGSVSSTTLRTILKPGGPAIVQHDRAHPRESAAFDFGGAAHRMVLGKGDEIVEVKADDWRKQASQDARDAARAEGKRPLLSKDVRRAEELAALVLAHPVAGPLFDGTCGVPERTVIWRDDVTGVMCRAMLDVFPHLDDPEPTGGDLKTAESVEKRKLRSHVVDYGYHQQQAHYEDGVASIGLDLADWLFIFVRSKPPHLIRPVRLTPAFVDIGRRRNREALDLFAYCRERNQWPGLPPEVQEIDPPGWADTREED